MVKTATNPVIEATAAARSATERANQTFSRQDIEEAISKWEEVVQTMTEDGISEDQADIFTLYAGSLLLRWDLTHNMDDIGEIAANLEKALDKLPHSSTKKRYELLIRLGNVHQSWYQNFKDNSEVLTRAIQYWEDAYGLSAILRCMKEAANRILPSLANAYFVTFQDEISGIDSLHQAISYYQLSLVQARLEMQSRLRIGLGKVYLELMHHGDDIENAQLAIDSFEIVLKRSKEKEELVEASNGKTEGWWWKIVFEERSKFIEENLPFHEWTESVATAYPDNGVAVGYHAMSFRWINSGHRERLTWFHLAWMLLKFKRQSPPPGFHYLYCHSLSDQYQMEKFEGSESGFEDLPMLLLAIEHCELFSRAASLKDFYMFQRGHVIPRSRHPADLDATQWTLWRNTIVQHLERQRRLYLRLLSENYNAWDAIVDREEVFRAQIESRLVRPRNFPLQE